MRVKDRRFFHLTDVLFSIMKLIRETALTEFIIKKKKKKMFLPDFLLDQFW